MRLKMIIKLLKWLSIVALLVGLLWRSSQIYQWILESIVSVSALVLIWQAIQLSKYLWAVGFVAIAVVLNPILPLGLSRSWFFLVDLGCLLAFAISLATLKSRPLLSIPSITNRRPGSESL
jgi:Family of unknown function (DUF6804)